MSVYNTGDIAVFRNDTTGVFDTLHVTQKGYGTSSFENCNQVNNVLNVFFTFSHINGGHIQKIHNEAPTIGVTTYIVFPLTGLIGSMTINGTFYNDVFVTSIDSTTIPSNNKSQIPWKLAYSNSNGFIRFYMVNGQTWSKL